MKTTKAIVDEILEEEAIREGYIIQCERDYLERMLMQELFEEEQTKIVLGKPIKRKHTLHGTKVIIKLPRFIKAIQH